MVSMGFIKTLLTAVLEVMAVALGLPLTRDVNMDVNPQEWHPRHQLEQVTVTVQFVKGGEVRVVASGRSSGQRADLWRHSEVIDGDESRLVVADHLHHMLLVALQDRPRSLEAFQRGLVGEGWEDVPLPF